MRGIIKKFQMMPAGYLLKSREVAEIAKNMDGKNSRRARGNRELNGSRVNGVANRIDIDKNWLDFISGQRMLSCHKGKWSRYDLAGNLHSL